MPINKAPTEILSDISDLITRLSDIDEQILALTKERQSLAREIAIKKTGIYIGARITNGLETWLVERIRFSRAGIVMADCKLIKKNGDLGKRTTTLNQGALLSWYKIIDKALCL